ncbi:unnamed protein product [Rhizophagus irregularis]|nr:unnamed protein product [Rhizophagus irregularis]
MILNQDCLTLIIEKLYESKHNSLFSCLLVNRIWCRIVIPIIWKDPWFILSKINNEEIFFKNSKLLLNIILLHLSKESRNYLENQGINIFNKLNFQKNTLLFDYLTFSKYIKHKINFKNGSNIYDEIFHFYNNDQRNLIIQEIYKIFMIKCSNIKFLDIIGILQPFYKYPEEEIKISKIQELQCKSNDNPLLFNKLTQICKFIQKFIIIYTNSNIELTKLIESQLKVKYIKIFYMIEDDDILIYQAIMKHSTTINYLDLTIENNLNFINILLPKLINLKKLILHGSLFYRLDLDKQFISSFYPKLQILQLCSISFSIIIKIIQNTEGNLQIIWLGSNKFENVDQNGQLIRTISQHCPNLKYLKIFLKDYYLEDFKQLLINCSLLEGIVIYTDNLYLNYCGDELLNILKEYSPINLHKLELDYCKFEIKSLDSFLNNWRNRRSLYLYSVNTEYNHIDKFNDMIELYKKEGIIKKFKPDKNYNFMNDYKGMI